MVEVVTVVERFVRLGDGLIVLAEDEDAIWTLDARRVRQKLKTRALLGGSHDKTPETMRELINSL